MGDDITKIHDVVGVIERCFDLIYVMKTRQIDMEKKLEEQKKVIEKHDKLIREINENLKIQPKQEPSPSPPPPPPKVPREQSAQKAFGF